LGVDIHANMEVSYSMIANNNILNIYTNKVILIMSEESEREEIRDETHQLQDEEQEESDESEEEEEEEEKKQL
jgi:hypothetical protein